MFSDIKFVLNTMSSLGKTPFIKLEVSLPGSLMDDDLKSSASSHNNFPDMTFACPQIIGSIIFIASTTRSIDPIITIPIAFSRSRDINMYQINYPCEI